MYELLPSSQKGHLGVYCAVTPHSYAAFKPPALSDAICCYFFQVQCACLLKWHSDWAAASTGLTQPSATWLYALTARLERPLTQVRTFCRKVRL